MIKEIIKHVFGINDGMITGNGIVPDLITFFGLFTTTQLALMLIMSVCILWAMFFSGMLVQRIINIMKRK